MVSISCMHFAFFRLNELHKVRGEKAFKKPLIMQCSWKFNAENANGISSKKSMFQTEKLTKGH